MQPICLLGDSCTGHADFPPRNNTGSDHYLVINGRPVHCVGHGWADHCNPVPVCHAGVLAAGSAYMTVNGNAVARIGDPISCGSQVATGDSYWVLD
ncbi:PAAR domain-containing protein [Spartinivicinus ruber]|uniref:PAAR domain-containing protein n=1 Tax=Spartinivicinus ruber TaxID=2683272 RepID=UPI0013D32D8F|nr:PAAR domain-containing protein [Spartinivicinus ruber]